MAFVSYTDTRGSHTPCLNWDRIYTILNSDDFFEFQNEAPIYQNISNSHFHVIATRLMILWYTELVKWVIDFVDLPTSTSRDANQMVLANIKPNTFAKIYALKVL